MFTITRDQILVSACLCIPQFSKEQVRYLVNQKQSMILTNTPREKNSTCTGTLLSAKSEDTIHITTSWVYSCGMWRKHLPYF